MIFEMAFNLGLVRNLAGLGLVARSYPIYLGHITAVITEHFLFGLT